jgi:5-methyltetrahydrofolate--homocysteine methyltransferase
MELQEIHDCVLNGEADQIVSAVKRALNAGASAEAIISDALIKAMDEVGTRMKEGDMFIPEVLMAAKTMKKGMDVVQPLLEGGKVNAIGKIAIGTVSGDLHDIGKDLVLMMLEGAGFEVIDMGVDVSADKFLKVIEEQHPDIIGVSALLTTTMKTMEETVKAIGNKAKTLIGGAPVTEEFAQKIGASGYAPDAVTAIDVAKSLMA